MRLTRPRYRARFARNEAEIDGAQRLRHKAFIAGTDARPRAGGVDSDAFDQCCHHILIEEVATGALVACFRLLPLASGQEIARSYAAQFYGLDGLRDFDAPMIEMGRFCIDPDRTDPEILRVAWAAMTRYVDDTGAGLLFGCSSFRGVEAGAYADAFAMLRDRHLAPERWRPAEKAKDIVRFARRLRRKPDLKRALREMPPLLRGYLAMGGWVSDHAVIDRDLGTLHVFTGLEISAIPPARVRSLRRVAV